MKLTRILLLFGISLTVIPPWFINEHFLPTGLIFLATGAIVLLLGANRLMRKSKC